MKLLKKEIGNTDIYIIDQILKDRYRSNTKILDAGCGHGRNIHWFVQQKMSVYGIDRAADRIEAIHTKYPALKANFQVAGLDQISRNDDYFDHIICSAVLHFADSEEHFKTMFKELIRVLKPNGTLFIRMCSDIGIADKVKPLGDGRYFLPDQTNRFLLTQALLSQLVEEHNLVFLELLKTTNVNDIRAMSTLMLSYT